jgi:hypothetical protein
VGLTAMHGKADGRNGLLGRSLCCSAARSPTGCGSIVPEA